MKEQVKIIDFISNIFEGNLLLEDELIQNLTPSAKFDEEDHL